MNFSETNENGIFYAKDLMYLWNSLAHIQTEFMANILVNIYWNGEFWETNLGLFCLEQKTGRANENESPVDRKCKT